MPASVVQAIPGYENAVGEHRALNVSVMEYRVDRVEWARLPGAGFIYDSIRDRDLKPNAASPFRIQPS